MVEGTVQNKNSLIPRGRDCLPLRFRYLNSCLVHQIALNGQIAGYQL